MKLAWHTPVQTGLAHIRRLQLRWLALVLVFTLGVLHATYMWRISALDVVDGVINDVRLLMFIPSDPVEEIKMAAYKSTGLKQKLPHTYARIRELSHWLDTKVNIAPDLAMTYELGSLGLLVLVFAYLLQRRSPQSALLLGTGLALLLITSNFYLHWRFFWGLPIASSLLVCLTATAIFAVIQSNEHYDKRKLEALFGAYVPAELVKQMVQDPRHYSMTAKNENLSIMFCDLRGFTRLSERMDPLALQDFLGQLLGRISQVIQNHNGTIDKYIGDSVMAFWGAPIAMANHAEMAGLCAQAIKHEIARINLERSQLGLEPLAVSIGLNSGLVCVGDMGTALRRSYTAIGDAVNVANRLQDLAHYYDVTILAGEACAKASAHLPWQRVDEQASITGRDETERLYTLD